MTTTVLRSYDEMAPLPGRDAADEALAKRRPLAVRILECVAIIGVPLTVMVFVILAAVRFS